MIPTIGFAAGVLGASFSLSLTPSTDFATSAGIFRPLINGFGGMFVFRLPYGVQRNCNVKYT